MNRKTWVPALAACLTLGCSAAYADTEETTTTTTTVQTTTVAPFVLPGGATYVVIDPLTGASRGVLDPATRLLNGSALPSGTVVSDQLTGKIVAVVDSNGNLLDINTAPATTVFVSSIDARKIELDRDLTDALAAGKINSAQATAMRSEMERLFAAEIAAKQSGAVLTYAQALPIAYGLTVIGARLNPYISTTVTPILGQRIIVQNGVLLYTDEFSYQRIVMERRIDDEYTAGRLSSKQVADLKGELSEAATLQSKYTRKGVISDSDQRKIQKRMDYVRSNLDKDIAIINGKRARIGIRVD